MKHQTEYEIQRDIFSWAAQMEHKYPELKWLNGSLNGVRLSIGYAVKMKRIGMKRGFPDINLPVNRRGFNRTLNTYFGLYIELKTEKGTVSKEQKEWIKHLQSQGYFACVCKGKEAAIRIITHYLEGEL
jgi:hypothetical protein